MNILGRVRSSRQKKRRNERPKRPLFYLSLRNFRRCHGKTKSSGRGSDAGGMENGGGQCQAISREYALSGYSLYYAGLDHQEPGEEGVFVESSYWECLFVQAGDHGRRV